MGVLDLMVKRKEKPKHNPDPLSMAHGWEFPEAEWVD